MRIAARRAKRQGNPRPCDDRARIEESEPELCGPAADGQRGAHTDRRQWAARVQHGRIDRARGTRAGRTSRGSATCPAPDRRARRRSPGQTRPEQARRAQKPSCASRPIPRTSATVWGVAELPSGATREPSLPASAVIVLSFVPPSRRSLLRESRFALIAPLAALVAYFPAIVVPYGFMDDYYLLAWQRGLEGEFWKTATQFGRPLHALFLSGAFGLASDIGALRLVRLLGLLGVMLLAVLLYYVLRQAGFGRWLSTGICVSVVSLASFQIYVSWAAIFEAPYVAVLAGLASLRLRSASGLEGRRCAHPSGRGRHASSLRAAQLSACRDVLLGLHRDRRVTPGPGACSGVAEVRRKPCGGGSGAVLRLRSGANRRALLRRCVRGPDEPRARSRRQGTVVLERADRQQPRDVQPHPDRERGSRRSQSSPRSGSFSSTASPGQRALGFLGLAVAFVPLSYTPNLVISENFASYRSTGSAGHALDALSVVGPLGHRASADELHASGARRVVTRVVVLALAALASFAALALIVVPLPRPLERVSVHTLTQRARARCVRRCCSSSSPAPGCGRRETQVAGPSATAVGALAMTAFVLGGVLIAARNVTTLVVKPQSVELQLVRSELSSAIHTGPHLVVFVKPYYTEGAAPLVRYDEFGPPSTYFPWVPSPAGPARPARETAESASRSCDLCLGRGSGVEGRAGRRVRGHAGAAKAPRRVELLDAPRTLAYYGSGGRTFRATTVTMSNRFNGRL